MRDDANGDKANLDDAIGDDSDESDEQRDDAVIGVALRYSLVVLLCAGSAIGAVVAYRAWRSGRVEPIATRPVDLPSYRAAVAPELPLIPWADITESAGITFIHENGAAGEKLLPETMGGGAAFFDYNGDGHPDILFVGSQIWDHDRDPESEPSADTPQPSSLALFENDGRGNFRDVTAEVGLEMEIYGQGCAIGDFDNDGRPDIFISAVSQLASNGDPEIASSGADRVGPNRLLRNLGDRFVDVTDTAGVAGEPGDWSTSCGWFDFDNDGDLDLWVCNYVDWSRQYDRAQNFRLTGGQRAYGRPQAFGGSYPRLYRNDGDGKFTEVSAEAGIRIDAATTGAPLAKSLGLAFHDFDHDGYLDVMVANDTVQNQLFRNRGDGTFEEIAAISGVAFDSAGNARGAMGIDIACAREDSRCASVVIGNFSNEMSAFYVSAPESTVFTDQAVANGLGPSTRLYLTFAALFFDADLDGWLDILHANGHLEEDIAKVQRSQTYEQSPQLFWNAGPDSLTEFVALPVASTGQAFAAPMVGRGATYADIDGDGDLDLLITATGARPRLLRNDQQLGHNWLRVKLVGNGTTSNRDAIGARVDLDLASGRRITKTVSPTRGYLSQVELPLTFGLGNDSVRGLSVSWPDGARETIDLADLLADPETTDSATSSESPGPNRLIEIVQKP